MAASGGEVRSLVNQLRGDFHELYGAALHRYDIVYNRHGFNGIAKGLPTIEGQLDALGFARRIPVTSGEVNHAAGQLVNRKLDKPFELHIQAIRDGDKAKADKLEIIEANLLVHLDQGGRLTHTLNRHIAVSPYAPLWVEKTPYNLPKREKGESDTDYNDRADRWRREYRAVRVRVGDPLACAFLEDGALNITTAVEEMEVPIINFIEDYGDYDREDDDPDLMWTVWTKQFGHVRAAYGVSEDRAEFGSLKRIKVCMVDDGRMIRHYVNLPNDSKGYELASENSEWPNPFGRCSLHIAPGRWNPDAVEPINRYEPLLLPLMQSRWNKDMNWSQLASRAAELPPWGVELTPDMASQYMQMSGEERKAFEDQGELQPNSIRYLLGKATDMTRNIGDHFAQLNAEMAEEHSLYRPSVGLDDPDQALARQAPSSTVLLLKEVSDADVKEAQTNKLRVLIGILEDHEYYWANEGKKGHPPKGETVYGMASGQERVRGKEVVHGTRVELPAGQFDFPKVRELEPVDTSASQMAAALDIAYKRMQAPDGKSYISREDVYTAMRVPNPEEYDIQVRAEGRYRNVEHIAQALTLASGYRDMALTRGVDLQELLATLGQAPPPQQGQQPSGGPNGSGTMQMIAPRTNGTDMTVTQ